MMKLMTMKQYMKMSKPALIRKIIKTLRAMPKQRLAIVCYNLTKSKLPRLRTRKQKALREYTGEFTRSIPSGRLVPMTRRLPKRKTKRKALPMKGKYSTFLPQTVEGQAFEARTYSRTRPYFEVKKKRKFSRKQLAAQRLFAKRARAGTLRK